MLIQETTRDFDKVLTTHPGDFGYDGFAWLFSDVTLTL